MKLGIIIASLALAAVTGCASEEEETQQPVEEKKAPEVEVKVEEAPAQPQMMCKSWGYIDGKRVCLY